MKRKFLFILSSASLYSMTVMAGARWIPHKCGFDVPRLHRDQRWGLYEAFGATRDEAKLRALRACQSELDASHPGACIEYGKDSMRWACNWSPRWEY